MAPPYQVSPEPPNSPPKTSPLTSSRLSSTHHARAPIRPPISAAKVISYAQSGGLPSSTRRRWATSPTTTKFSPKNRPNVLIDSPKRLMSGCTSGELYDRADPVLVVHQLEALVDLVERDAVADERRHVDVAVEGALHELRDLVAALDAAEGRARHAAARDQVARDDVQRLPLAGYAGDGAQAPAHARGLDGLAHDLDVAGRLEGVVGAEAARLLEHALDGLVSADPRVRRALVARELQPVLGEVDADDALSALQAAAGDGAEADHAGPEDHAGGAGPDPGRVHRGAEAGAEPAGEQRGVLERRLGVHLGEG